MKNLLKILVAFSFTTFSISQESEKPFHALQADSSITCEKALEIIKNPNTPPDEYTYALTVLSKCNMEKWNSEHPDDKKISIAHVDNKKERILFKTLDYQTAEDIKNASKYVLDLYSSEIGQTEPITGAIVYLGGRYSVDAFFEAAVNDDPFIFLSPTMIPGNKLTKDTVKELGDFGKKSEKAVKKAAKKVENHLKKNPEDLIIPGSSVLKKIKIKF